MEKQVKKKQMIPLQKPYFDEKEEKVLVQVLRSGWVTQGPKVKEFEEAVCKFTGAKYAVATTSATTALFLSLHSISIDKGDEVIVPSFSFIATANVVVHVGATPVFVDIDPKTYNLDVKDVEKKITKKTKVIIVVDQVGLPCDHDQFERLAKRYNLHIIEDAACALGSEYRGKKIGSFGKLVCLSFHPRKVITTGEGGMILTSSKEISDRLKLLRHQGMSMSDVTRHKAKRIMRESYPVIGYNFRLSDIQAAVGVEQMRKLPEFLKKRAALAKRYTNAFSKSKNIIPPYVPSGYVHNWQSYLIRLKPNRKITRDELMQKLLNVGISTRIGVMATHLEKPYKKMYPRLTLRETESATRETITLPLFYQMSAKQQDFIISKVLELTEG